MLIDSHEKFLKEYSSGFFKKLKKEGYIGSEDTVHTHFLRAVIKLSESVDIEFLKRVFKGARLEREYFNILVFTMNKVLSEDEHENSKINYLETPIGNIPFSKEENNFYNNLNDIELIELYLKKAKQGFVPPKPFQIMKNRGLVLREDLREDIEKRLKKLKKNN